MSNELSGQVAIVTGGAQGIGAAYARRLAELGATVVVADIDAAAATAMAKELTGDGLSAWSARVDISDPESAAALASTVVERDGRIDVLVNNAAIYRGLELAAAEDIELAAWRRIVDVNLSGTFYMCRAVIPQMRQQRSGKIVNQASTAAYIAAPLALGYCATKAAVVSITKVLARELGEDNITVNAIAPGIIGTPATLDTVPEPMQDMLVATTAIQRMGVTEDLLGVLHLLCTSASDYMTGQTLVVDGGGYLLG